MTGANTRQLLRCAVIGTMRVGAFGSHSGKARVVLGHIAGQPGVGLLDGADAGQPQGLDQTVLQGLEGPLDAAFGLGRVGQDGFDVQLAKGHLPAALTAVLALEPQIISWSEDFASKEPALFLGRGLHYPIALQGGLKLKEITYIHAEGYAAGELKHGPLALVTSEMPVVTVAPNDALIEKLKSSMQEVRARGGVLYVLADADSRIESEDGIHVIRMPDNYGALSPMLHVVPLQPLAYHTACARGTDVDKPRNLAKSVTVE